MMPQDLTFPLCAHHTLRLKLQGADMRQDPGVLGSGNRNTLGAAPPLEEKDNKFK